MAIYCYSEEDLNMRFKVSLFAVTAIFVLAAGACSPLKLPLATPSHLPDQTAQYRSRESHSQDNRHFNRDDPHPDP